jgi:AraC-like DNA-binding protein
MESYYKPNIEVWEYDRIQLRYWNFDHISVPYWRLYWNDCAGASLVCHGDRVDLLPGRYLLLAPNTSYSTRLERQVEHFYVHFALAPPFTVLNDSLFQLEADSTFQGMVEELMALKESGHAAHMMRASLILNSLLSTSLLQIPADRFSVSETFDTRILCILDFIDQNLGCPLSNQELAEKAHMSTNSFVRFFREKIGLPPQGYLRHKRVQQACLLLHFSDDTIEEIARKTGFYDRYHFSRVFKKIQGVPPVLFRKHKATG